MRRGGPCRPSQGGGVAGWIQQRSVREEQQPGRADGLDTAGVVLVVGAGRLVARWAGPLTPVRVELGTLECTPVLPETTLVS